MITLNYRATANRLQEEQRREKKMQQDAEAQQYAAEQQRKGAEQQRKSAEERGRVEMWSKYGKGSEDSCKRSPQTYAVQLDPDSADVICQFGGAFNVKDMNKAGWLIVNKQRTNDGMVTEYYIRKVR